MATSGAFSDEPGTFRLDGYWYTDNTDGAELCESFIMAGLAA